MSPLIECEDGRLMLWLSSFAASGGDDSDYPQLTRPVLSPLEPSRTHPTAAA